MTQSIPADANNPRHTFGEGYLFGVPVRDLGWFASLLTTLASGFLAFFAATFCAIFAILIYNIATHSNVDLAFSYSRVGLPVGLAVLAFAALYLGRLWLKRIFRPN